MILQIVLLGLYIYQYLLEKFRFFQRFSFYNSGNYWEFVFILQFNNRKVMQQISGLVFSEILFGGDALCFQYMGLVRASDSLAGRPKSFY